MIANMAGIKRAEYFETSAVEAQVPNVNFGNQAPGTFGTAPTPPVVGGASTQPGSLTGPSTQPGQSQSASGTAGPGARPYCRSAHAQRVSPSPPTPRRVCTTRLHFVESVQ